MSIEVIPIGDDRTVQVTLKINDTPENLTGSIIQACIAKSGINQPVNSLIDVLETTANSDWTNGIIQIVFTSAFTATLDPGNYRLEIQRTLAGKKTTWIIEDALKFVTAHID